MLLLRGATFSGLARRFGTSRFNTCSSCEEQLVRKLKAERLQVQFQYMLLLRGATSQQNYSHNYNKEFQYMLLLRGATPRKSTWARRLTFQYMLLLRGATLVQQTKIGFRKSFNTCSSCEEQLDYIRIYLPFLVVSIHAPLARSNYVLAKNVAAR